VFREDPLLKVGVIVMTLALALVIVAVVVSFAVRSVPERAVASERTIKEKHSTRPLVRSESSMEPWVEMARSLPTAEVTKNESNLEPSGEGPKPTRDPAPKVESRSRSEPLPQPQSRSGSDPENHVPAEPEAQPESEPGQRTLPAGESDWSRPTQQEIEAANEPRHYDLPAGAIMGLTIPSIGIYDAPVYDSASQWALANGIAHLPDTSLPWSDTPQRNVYLAGHRMGYRGTWSRMLFYNLGKVAKGDKVVLKDRSGRTYEYRVSESFLAEPTDAWVTGQVRGRDMLTLQTCTPIPTFEKRLIVRAFRV